MNHPHSLFLTCILILLGPSLWAQKPAFQKTTPRIQGLLLNEAPPPFFVKAGMAYNLQLQVDSHDQPYYWGVWMDVNGDGQYDEETESLYCSGLEQRPRTQASIQLPADWDGTLTQLRVMLAPTPHFKPNTPYKHHYDHQDVPVLIPFTSQIDLGVDNKTFDNCLNISTDSLGYVRLTLKLTVSYQLVPAPYTHLQVITYGFGVNAAPLEFGSGQASLFQGNFPIPATHDGELQLSVPLNMLLSSLLGGEAIGHNSCQLTVYMEVKGLVPGSIRPEVFMVATPNGEVPSVEYLSVPLCACERDPMLRQG